MFGDRVRISNFDLRLTKGYRPKFTREVFEIVSISSRKPPTYTIKVGQDEIIRLKFHRNSSSKSFNNGIVYKKKGF